MSEPGPPARIRRWLVPAAAALIGVAIGLGAFTFVYAKGYSYLTTDPAACANCHIMDEHYAAWLKSSHRAVAGCNDCHTPHDVVGKYATKARNGFWHSFYFTTGGYPYPLRITERNREIVEHACRDCHERMTLYVDHPVIAAAAADAESRDVWGDAGERVHEPEPISCVKCHRHVGHWVR